MTWIPPQSEMEIMARAPGIDATTATTWLVESNFPECRSAIVVARAVVTPEKGDIPVQILNPREDPVCLQKGCKIAQVVNHSSLTYRWHLQTQ